MDYKIDDMTQFFQKKVKEEGKMIMTMTFYDLKEHGIVTDTKVNPEYFAGQAIATKIGNKLRLTFMDEMTKAGAFVHMKGTVQ